jgi:hypothetical protein
VPFVIEDSARAPKPVLSAAVPGTYRHLHIYVQGRSTGQAVDVSWGIQLNGDTGPKYLWQQLRANAAGPLQLSTGGGGTEVRAGMGTMPAAMAAAGHSGVAEVMIPNYTQTDFYPTVRACSAESWQLAEGNIACMMYSGVYLVLGPVTSVQAILDLGLWDIGSIMSVFGE